MSRFMDFYIIHVNEEVRTSDEFYDLLIAGITTGVKPVDWLINKVHKPKLHENGTITFHCFKNDRDRMMEALKLNMVTFPNIREYRIIY